MVPDYDFNMVVVEQLVRESCEVEVNLGHLEGLQNLAMEYVEDTWSDDVVVSRCFIDWRHIRGTLQPSLFDGGIRPSKFLS